MSLTDIVREKEAMVTRRKKRLADAERQLKQAQQELSESIHIRALHVSRNLTYSQMIDKLNSEGACRTPKAVFLVDFKATDNRHIFHPTQYGEHDGVRMSHDHRAKKRDKLGCYDTDSLVVKDMKRGNVLRVRNIINDALED